MNPVRFQITINGEPYFDPDDITALTLVVEEIWRRDEERISLHASGGEDSMQWLVADLKVGDEIVVKIIDSLREIDQIPDTCSFCGRESHEVSGFIAGGNVVICEECVTGFSQAITAQKRLPIGAAIHDEPSWACGFCGKSPDVIPGLIVRNGAAICPECLHACSDISSQGPEENRE